MKKIVSLLKWFDIIRKRLYLLPLFISIIAFLSIIYDFGFDQSEKEENLLQIIYVITLITGIFSTLFRYIFKDTRPRFKTGIVDFVLVAVSAILIPVSMGLTEQNFSMLLTDRNSIWLYFTLFLIFIREYSALKIDFKRTVLNPAQLFVLGFLFVIILGSFMLLLPKSTHSGISLVNAIFTSTSAVCVTGLSSVDTGTTFTDFGQFILLSLIQIGGLGIMTFAGYFAYFFKGSTSYENQIVLRDLTSTEKIGEIFVILKKILLVTLIIEGVGALLVYINLNPLLLKTFSERIWFSIFHSVSAFCNAGFSTLPNNLAQAGFQFNYPLHLIIAFLIIIGGIGFPIVFNIFSYTNNILKNTFSSLFFKKKPLYMPWIININTRIILITTISLLIFGTVTFFIFEYNNTLAVHGLWGKIVTSFFGSVTPRTAGFNTVDNSLLTYPTLLIVFFLMWVGASPASTGGGIKTSTLAVSVLNFLSLAKGKARVEIFRREIAQSTINRASAIVMLSILIIGLSIIFVSIFDSEKGLLNISFECVSAFGTVGLSRGITASLSEQSKIIIVLTMFIGRVNMLTLLIALVKKTKYLKYRYPTEEILIN